MRTLPLATLLLASASLGACSTWKPPAITYDDTPQQAVLQPDPPKPVQVVELPKLLPLPGQLKPISRARTVPRDAADPHARVEQANGAARVEPTRAGYSNAIQVYPYSDGPSIRSMRRPARSPTSLWNPETTRLMRRQCPGFMPKTSSSRCASRTPPPMRRRPSPPALTLTP